MWIISPWMAFSFDVMNVSLIRRHYTTKGNRAIRAAGSWLCDQHYSLVTHMVILVRCGDVYRNSGHLSTVTRPTKLYVPGCMECHFQQARRHCSHWEWNCVPMENIKKTTSFYNCLIFTSHTVYLRIIASIKTTNIIEMVKSEIRIRYFIRRNFIHFGRFWPLAYDCVLWTPLWLV